MHNFSIQVSAAVYLRLLFFWNMAMQHTAMQHMAMHHMAMHHIPEEQKPQHL
jgi:hypothetical protein